MRPVRIPPDPPPAYRLRTRHTVAFPRPLVARRTVASLGMLVPSGMQDHVELID